MTAAAPATIRRVSLGPGRLHPLGRRSTEVTEPSEVTRRVLRQYLARPERPAGRTPHARPPGVGPAAVLRLGRPARGACRRPVAHPPCTPGHGSPAQDPPRGAAPPAPRRAACPSRSHRRPAGRRPLQRAIGGCATKPCSRCSTAAACACRSSAACASEDLALDRGKVTVWGKGSKQRVVPVRAGRRSMPSPRGSRWPPAHGRSDVTGRRGLREPARQSSSHPAMCVGSWTGGRWSPRTRTPCGTPSPLTCSTAVPICARAGAARARRSGHHADLHPRQQGAAAPGVRRDAPRA
jgi:hypothetical protein